MQRTRSGSARSLGTPAVEDTPERGTPSSRSNKLQDMIAASLAETEELVCSTHSPYARFLNIGSMRSKKDSRPTSTHLARTSRASCPRRRPWRNARVRSRMQAGASSLPSPTGLFCVLKGNSKPYLISYSLAELRSSLQGLEARARKSFPSASESRDTRSLSHELQAAVKEGLESKSSQDS